MADREPIHALVIGPGATASGVIEQLAKNQRFNITWAGKDVDESEYFDDNIGDVIRTIDLEKAASPLRFNEIVDDIRPDIVFLCQRGSDWDVEDMVASTNMERSMLGESIRIGNAPVITVSLEQHPQ